MNPPHDPLRCLAALLLVACTTQPPALPPMPEIAPGPATKPGSAFTPVALAAANPLAVDAGYQILQAGGNALDAAVAVQMVLALVEPQSSGIGGGAFLLHWDAQRVQAWDDRETAHAAADGCMFLQPDGKPLLISTVPTAGRMPLVTRCATPRLRMCGATSRHKAAWHCTAAQWPPISCSACKAMPPPSVVNPLLDGMPGADWLHVYTEAARLVFADRGQYVAGPDFVAPPAGAWARPRPAHPAVCRVPWHRSRSSLNSALATSASSMLKATPWP